MLGRHRESLSIYRRLIRRGTNSIARGPCGEGPARARALILDCWYRVAHSETKLKNYKAALAAYRRHLQLRSRTSGSIYSKRMVTEELSKVAKMLA